MVMFVSPFIFQASRLRLRPVFSRTLPTGIGVRGASIIQRNIHPDIDPYRHARPRLRYRVYDRPSERSEPDRFL